MTNDTIYKYTGWPAGWYHSGYFVIIMLLLIEPASTEHLNGYSQCCTHTAMPHHVVDTVIQYWLYNNQRLHGLSTIWQHTEFYTDYYQVIIHHLSHILIQWLIKHKLDVTCLCKYHSQYWILTIVVLCMCYI